MIVKPTNKRRATGLAIVIGALSTAAYSQNTIPQTDPPKAYSTIGLASGETLQLDVINIGGTNGFPPGPCIVQMGFVNAAGVLLKSSNATIQTGQAAFLTLTFAEGSASTSTSTTVATSLTRVNIRPVLVTIPPGPCRTVSSAEVFDASLGRAHLYAVPTEPPPDPDTPPGPPIFGIAALTTLDALRVNVTNITGSNGFPPDPCNVQMGFLNAAGATVKAVAGTIEPGHTAFVDVTYGESAALATNTAARLNLHPFVNVPPDPCRVTASTELLNAASGETTLYILPAVPANVGPTTNGQ